MSESSSSRLASTSNLQNLLLQRIAGVKNETLAHEIGTEQSHITYFVKGERGLRIHQLEPFLKSLGLKVIECEGALATIPREELDALRYFTRKANS